MRPSQKGWIKDYLGLYIDLEKSHNIQARFHADFRGLTQDKKIYKLVQPSGLMYGHPVQVPIHYNISISKWNESEKMKFILLDCLLNEAILFSSNSIESNEDFQECIFESIKSISEFYQQNLNNTNTTGSFLRKRKSEYELIELILNKRLRVKSRWTKNFWAGFFENSLVFLDVYNFSLWYSKDKIASNSHRFQENQENLRFDILKVIAAAAYADKKIDAEERTLFNFFLRSANLSRPNERLAKELLTGGLGLENIEIDRQDPWIIRKYMLELAILTVWADKRVEEVEKEFINQLYRKLGFVNDELEGSLLAVESFVISNWEQIHFLQSRHDILIIKDRFSKRLSQIVNKNKHAFVQEIKESKELMRLIKKMSREKLSVKEKMIVRAQLLDILKTLPTFVIIALPGTFITLPLLLNLLPRSAFPSAFSEVD